MRFDFMSLAASSKVESGSMVTTLSVIISLTVTGPPAKLKHLNAICFKEVYRDTGWREMIGRVVKVNPDDFYLLVMDFLIALAFFMLVLVFLYIAYGKREG